MNIHSTKCFGTLMLLASSILLLGGTTKSCSCIGGKNSIDCRAMLSECEPLENRDIRPDDLVCTSEACHCNKKISVDNDRFGLGRFENVTDGTSKTLMLGETVSDRKAEKVTARRGDAPTPEAPTPEAATEETEEAEPKERKVRDHRD